MARGAVAGRWRQCREWDWQEKMADVQCFSNQSRSQVDEAPLYHLRALLVRGRKTLLLSPSHRPGAGRYLGHSRACGASPGTRAQQQIIVTASRFVSVLDAASQRLSGRRTVLADRLADDPNLCPPVNTVGTVTIGCCTVKESKIALPVAAPAPAH